MISFLKHLRLLKAFFKASLAADIEYRANFSSRIITDVFWYAAQIFLFENLFLHTQKIGDWNQAQVRVFLGVLFVVDALYMIFFSENIDRVSERIRKGDLDLLLAKPVSSQFLFSCQRLNTPIFGNLLSGIAWLAFALQGLPDFNYLRLLWLLVLIPTGLISVYAVRFFFSSLTIILTKAENLQYLFYQIYRLGMRPDSIYTPGIRVVLLTALPVVSIASIPARALLEPPDYLMFAWVIAWALVLLYLSQKMWTFCLRFYSSASS